MVTYNIGIMICESPGYVKSQFSPLIPAGNDNLGMTDKLLLGGGGGRLTGLWDY